MAKTKKNHYRVGQTVCFIWSGVKKLGSIEERKPKNKKIFYNVRGEDGKLYESLYVDDSMIAAILSLETKIVEASFKKKLGKKAEVLEVVEEFESLDDITE